MVRLPHNIFKLILSFNGPRYECVMNGDPYMATPTRVFYTRGEHNYKNCTTPAIFRSDRVRRFPWVPWVDIKVLLYICEIHDCGPELEFMPMWGISCLEARLEIDSDDESDDVIRCSPKVSKMALQCEAFGPDLELYQRHR